MIKAFLFDYGGVITDGGRFGLSGRLAERLNIGEDAAWNLLKPAWDLYMRGKVDEDGLWQIVESESGQQIPADKRDIWNDWTMMRPLPEMVELVEDLKRQGYAVGLLSNVIPHTAADIQKNGGYDSFDFTVLSPEVGYAKPEPQIYNIAMSKLPGMTPEEVVFIDDQERCLIPARELGIHTILAKNSQQIAEDVSKLLAINTH